MLSSINKHLRDSSIIFNEAKHSYTVGGSENGVISVTTLIGNNFPKFNAQKVINNMRRSSNFSVSNYSTMSDSQIINKWSSDGNEAREAGILLHKYIEGYYNKGLEEYNSDSSDIDKFLEFNKKEIDGILEPYRTEWAVWGDRNEKGKCIAGQIDMLFFNKTSGKYSLFDWKRTKEIKKENRFERGLGPFSHLENCNYIKYSLQLNLYKWILEKYYSIVVENMSLLVLHPNNISYQIFTVSDMSEEINLLLKTL